MADYLPPVITKLLADTGEFTRKMEEAKLLIRSLASEIKDLNKDATIKLDVDQDNLNKAKGNLDDMAKAERKTAYDADAAAREIKRLGIISDEAFIIGKKGADDYQDKLKSLKSTIDGTWFDADKAMAENRRITLEANGAYAKGVIALREYADGLKEVKKQANDLSSSGWWQKIKNLLGKSVGLPGPLPNLPIWAIGAAILPLLALLASLSAEIGAVIAGFTAAAAGAGAFALFAVPAITKVFNALSKGTSKGLHGELLNVYNDIQNIIAEYHHLSAAFGRRWTPVALKLLDQFGQEAAKILPNLMPLANAAGKAFATLGSDLAKALGSVLDRKGVLTGVGQRMKEVFLPSAFQNAIKVLSQYAGPALIAIGLGISRVIIELGKFVAAWFKLMSVKDVVNGLNIFFGILAFTIRWVGKALLYLAANAMGMWDALSAGVKDLRNWMHNVNNIINNTLVWIGSAWNKFWPWFKAAILGIGILFKLAWGLAARIVAIEWGRISGFVESGIKYVYKVIAQYVRNIQADWRDGWKVIRDIANTAWHLIYNAAQTFGHLIYGVIKTVMDLVNGRWSAAWKQLWSTTGRWIHDVIHLITSLTSGFGHLLWDAGAALINGLIGGIKSALGPLSSLISTVTGWLKSIGGFLGFGGFQGSGATRFAGFQGATSGTRGGAVSFAPAAIHNHIYIDGREVQAVVNKQTYDYNMANGSRLKDGRPTGYQRPR